MLSGVLYGFRKACKPRSRTTQYEAAYTQIRCFGNRLVAVATHCGSRVGTVGTIRTVALQDVLGSATESLSLFSRRGELLGQTEISQDDVAEVIEQDVLRLVGRDSQQ